MAVTHRTGTVSSAPAAPLGVVAAGPMAVPDVLTGLGSSRAGLTAEEAAGRLRTLGPNAVRSHGARAFPVLGYLALIEIGKRWFYRTRACWPGDRAPQPGYRLLRRAARFTTADSLPDRPRTSDAKHGTV